MKVALRGAGVAFRDRHVVDGQASRGETIVPVVDQHETSLPMPKSLVDVTATSGQTVAVEVAGSHTGGEDSEIQATGYSAVSKVPSPWPRSTLDMARVAACCVLIPRGHDVELAVAVEVAARPRIGPASRWR